MSKKKITLVPAPDPAPLLLDLRSAAKYLSCTIWALRRLLWSGKLAYKKIGKKFCIPRAELERFATTDLRRAGKAA